MRGKRRGKEKKIGEKRVEEESLMLKTTLLPLFILNTLQGQNAPAMVCVVHKDFNTIKNQFMPFVFCYCRQ